MNFHIQLSTFLLFPLCVFAQGDMKDLEKRSPFTLGKYLLRYSPIVRQRGIEDPKAHNYPYSFDKEILKTKPVITVDGYQVFRKEGSMTGKTKMDPITGIRRQQYKKGYYEIGIRSDGTIDHRHFKSIKE